MGGRAAPRIAAVEPDSRGRWEGKPGGRYTNFSPKLLQGTPRTCAVEHFTRVALTGSTANYTGRPDYLDEAVDSRLPQTNKDLIYEFACHEVRRI
jgi:hypothetical protein